MSKRKIFHNIDNYPRLKDLIVQFKNGNYDLIYINGKDDWEDYIHPNNLLQSPVIRWCHLKDLDFIE